MPACSQSRPSRSAGLVSVALAALIGLVALTASSPAHADAPGATPAETADADSYPRIELVTMGVGSLIWERHGHIALCVLWGDPRRDLCYNYGVADFADPVGMGSAFFRGKESFWVAASHPDSMLSIYIRADRTVWTQRLPLTPTQKRQVIDKLRFDVKKENRYYAYDHFFDNCTTRVRDILDDAMGGAIKAINRDIGEETIRDYARKGFFGMRWALLITDLFMGRVTDKVPSYWERLYLPQYLREAFETEFGVKAEVMYQRKGPPPPEDSPSGRIMLALIILLLTAPAWLTRYFGRFERTGLAASLFLPSLLGLILWIGAIGSPVGYVRWNEAFFIFVPFDAALPFVSAGLALRYARIRVIGLLLVSLFLAITVFKQPLWVFVLWPIIPCAAVAFMPSKSAAGARSENTSTETEDAADAAKSSKPAKPSRKRPGKKNKKRKR